MHPLVPVMWAMSSACGMASDLPSHPWALSSSQREPECPKLVAIPKWCHSELGAVLLKERRGCQAVPAYSNRMYHLIILIIQSDSLGGESQGSVKEEKIYIFSTLTFMKARYSWLFFTSLLQSKLLYWSVPHFFSYSPMSPRAVIRENHTGIARKKL